MKTWIKKTAWFVAAIAVNTIANAQMSIEKRLEIEMNDGYGGEKVIPIGEKGFILISRSISKTEGSYQVRHNIYNSSMELQRSESILLKKGFNSSTIINREKMVYYMYHYKQKDAHIVTFDKSSSTLNNNSVEIPKGIKLYENSFSNDDSYLNYAAENGTFYQCGKYEKAPAVLAIDIKKGESTIIPISVDGIKTRKLKFYGINAIKGTNELAVIMKSKRNKKFYDTYCLIFDNLGNQKVEICLNSDLNLNLNSVSIDKMDERNYAVTGTYSEHSKLHNEGIYFGKFNFTGVEFLKTHNYTSMKTFFDYLSDKRQERIERKIQKAKEKGKEISYDYFMTSHNIMKLGNRYIYVGEAYVATQRTEISYSNGKAQQRLVFDGYQYSHGLVLGFDLEGNRVWDQTMTLHQSYKPFYVRQFITVGVNPNGNTIDLAFTSDWNIYMKQINSDGVLIKDQVSIPNKSDDPNDKVKYSISGEIDYWYDNYFINYGYQKIKNTEDKTKRQVFYINKIKL